jgi:hypothetical protein
MQIQTFIRKGVLSSRVGLAKRQAGDKYKYLMPLDSCTRDRIAPLSKPYPKRVRSENGDTPTVQVGEGGSTPTLTLQSSVFLMSAPKAFTDAILDEVLA